MDWVAEEVEEEGLGEGVELGEGGAALGPQRLRPVQHLRNPPLLRQRRQGDFESLQRRRIDAGLRDASRALRNLRPVIRSLKKVADEARFCRVANPNADEVGSEHGICRAFANEKALSGRCAGSRENNVSGLEPRVGPDRVSHSHHGTLSQFTAPS